MQSIIIVNLDKAIDDKTALYVVHGIFSNGAMPTEMKLYYNGELYDTVNMVNRGDAIIKVKPTFGLSKYTIDMKVNGKWFNRNCAIRENWEPASDLNDYSRIANGKTIALTVMEPF